MSSRPTPESDAAELYYDGETGFVSLAVSQRIEQERDALREALQKVASMAHGSPDKTVCLIMLDTIKRTVEEILQAIPNQPDTKENK